MAFWFWFFFNRFWIGKTGPYKKEKVDCRKSVSRWKSGSVFQGNWKRLSGRLWTLDEIIQVIRSINFLTQKYIHSTL